MTMRGLEGQCKWGAGGCIDPRGLSITTDKEWSLQPVGGESSRDRLGARGRAGIQGHRAGRGHQCGGAAVQAERREWSRPELAASVRAGQGAEEEQRETGEERPS